MATQDFYKQNGSYFTTSGQKIANPTELQGLARAGGKEVDMPVVPEGAEKISGPSGLHGLTEKDIFRQGQDIYKLPQVDNVVNPTENVPSIPEPEETPTEDIVSGMADTTIEGATKLVEQASKPSPAEAKIDPITKRVSELTEEAEQKPEDYLKEREEFGFTENVKQLQSLLPQIEQLKTQYDQAIQAQEGRVGSASSIYGRQALIQRQRATEIGGLSAMAQAYQGNIEMAHNIASQTVDIKYEPIQMAIDNQKFQLEQVYSQLGREDKRKADSLNIALEERQRLIEDEKEKEINISNIMLSAAQAGADQATLKRIQNSKTYQDAIKQAGTYLSEQGKDSGIKKIGTDADGNVIYYDGNIDQIITEDQLTVGGVLIPQSSRLAYVNNNPGNLRFANQEGATKGEGGFARFESPQEGYNALIKQIQLDKTREHTLGSFISKYAPPNENDTELYISQIEERTGFDRQAELTEVPTDILAREIARKESGTVIKEAYNEEEVEFVDKKITGLMEDVGYYDDNYESYIENQLGIEYSPENYNLIVQTLETVKKFNKDIDKELDKLAKGGEWGDSWNLIKNKYPDTPNQILDDLLRKEQFSPGEDVEEEEDTRTGWQRFWGINK